MITAQEMHDTLGRVIAQGKGDSFCFVAVPRSPAKNESAMMVFEIMNMAIQGTETSDQSFIHIGTLPVNHILKHLRDFKEKCKPVDGPRIIMPR